MVPPSTAAVRSLGVIINVLALPGSWVLRLIGATWGSKLTDQASLRLGMLHRRAGQRGAVPGTAGSARSTWPEIDAPLRETPPDPGRRADPQRGG